VPSLAAKKVVPQSANATITFYGSTGSQSGTPINTQIQPKAIYVVSSIGTPDGTMNVIADQPVTVVVNHFRNIGGDGGMSYTGIPR
jgi:hypothetical protein